jgi:CelD/BcsL family acetyltransferase involved in cellulose biosynthesis
LDGRFDSNLQGYLKHLALRIAAKIIWISCMADTAHSTVGIMTRARTAPTDHAQVSQRDLGVTLTVCRDIAAIADEWREFQREADCTVFQTLEWMETWQRHIGVGKDVRPAIVVGRDRDRNLLFIFPLSTQPFGFARELVWLGSELCDFNAPLLAPAFSQSIQPGSFKLLWKAIIQAIQSDPDLRYDLINLEKMPATVGSQRNPMLAVGVVLNPSGAYQVPVSGTWETFYSAARSSSTRRRDRTKRNRLAELGEVQLVTPDDPSDIASTLDTLMVQKARSFARMGIGNLFAKPGYRDFYMALATAPQSKQLVHVSELRVGTRAAAVNLGLKFRDRYYYVLASYEDDEQVARCGPGAAHLHELLRYAIERGFKIFDFTIGDEPYKRDWCDQSQPLYDYISSTSIIGSLVASRIRLKHWLKRSIKQNPSLWAAFSKYRALVGSVLKRK